MINVLAGVGVFVAGSAMGALIQGWRLDAKHADELAKCNNNYHQIELRIAEQNGGINLSNYKLQVAEEKAKAAEASAVFIRNQYTQQTKKSTEITATTCTGMLEALKGLH